MIGWLSPVLFFSLSLSLLAFFLLSFSITISHHFSIPNERIHICNKQTFTFVLISRSWKICHSFHDNKKLAVTSLWINSPYIDHKVLREKIQTLNVNSGSFSPKLCNQLECPKFFVATFFVSMSSEYFF